MNTSSNPPGGSQTATERLLLELERLRSERDNSSTRLQLTEKLLAQVPDAVFVADLDGRIIDVNSAACSLLGYEKQELVKMRPWDFATRASWEGVLGLISTMPLGEPVTVRRAYRCKSGEQKIVNVRLVRENHAGRDLIVVFSRVAVGDNRLEVQLRRTETGLTESQRSTSAGSIAADGTERTKVAQAVRRNEEYLRLTLDTIPTFVWWNRHDGSNEFLNRRWLDYTGLSMEAARGWGWQVAVHPEDLPRVLEVCSKLQASGEPGELEARLRRFDGVYRWFLFRFEPLFDEMGNIIKWYGTNTDIDDRRWAEAVLTAEKKILELITGNNSLTAILEALCRLVEEMFNRSLCAILFLDADGERLRKGVTASFPQDFIVAVDGVKIGPRVGSCGTAAYRKETVIVSDINTDPLWTDYREFALAYGLQAGWSTPILSAQEIVLGTFGIYYREPRSPTPQERKLIEQFARIASIAIEHARAQETLRRNEAYLAKAERLSQTGSFGWNVSTGKLVWSEETFRIVGYDPTTIPTLELALERVHPEDRALVQGILERASSDGANLDFEHRLLMPDNSVKHVHVVAEAVRSESDSLEFVGALMDITGRERAEEALRASEELARGQVEALIYSLDVLATASEPEKFLGRMLSTICRQLSGQSAALWLYDEPTESMTLQLMADLRGTLDFYDDRLLPRSSLSWGKNSGYQELLFACPVLCEDTATDPRLCPEMRDHFLMTGVKKFLAVPIFAEGRVRGMITIRHAERPSYRAEEVELAQALAHQVMLAIRLTEVGEQSRQTAVLAERNRMARDVHDTLAQGFTGVIVQLEAAEYAISEGDRQEADRHLRQAGELARRGLSEARRSVHALRPQALEEVNFWEALKGVVKSTTVGTALQTTFEAKGKVPALPPSRQENLLRIGQEALSNTLKYARAKHFRTRLTSDAKECRLELSDDGIGFEVTECHDGVGLAGMRERVQEMGGELKIGSSRGRGTKITVILPKDAIDRLTPHSKLDPRNGSQDIEVVS